MSEFNKNTRFGEKFVFSFKRLIAECGSETVALYKCETDLAKKDGTPLGELMIKGTNIPKRMDVLLKVESGMFQMIGENPVLKVESFKLFERKGFFKKPLFCKFEKLLFYNDNTGYTIAKYLIVNSDAFNDPDGFPIDEVKVLGYYLPVENNLNITFRAGDWEKDKRGKWQIVIKNYDIDFPDDREGMISYLSSLPSIGNVSAIKIVDKFGDQTYDIIEKNCSELAKLPRISKRKAEIIRDAHMAKKPAREIIQFLGAYGVTVNKALKIYDHYTEQGESTESIMARLKNTPFSVVEIDGFAFRTADNIAKAMRLDSLSPQRIRCAILFSLQEDTDLGHVYSNRADLVRNTCTLLNENPYPNQKRAVQEIDIEKELTKMISPLKLVYKEINDEIYLTKNYCCENNIAYRITQLLKAPSSTQINQEKAKIAVNNAIKKFEFKEAEKQAEAAIKSLINKVSIITGGPGTGKTSIIKIILEVYRTKFPKNKVVLCAPTGRAAQRMSESTGYPASTIHRMLKMGGNFKKSEDEEDENPIADVDLLIIDECSMIDIYLMNILLKNIPIHCKVIFVGDAYQLPSIGPGAVFNDFIKSEVIPTTTLEKIFRQEGYNSIAVNAANIKAGITDPLMQLGDDFKFIEATSSAACEEMLIEQFKEECDNLGKDFDKLQIIVPTRKEKAPLDPTTNKKDYSAVKCRCNSTTINRSIQKVYHNLPKEISKSGSNEYIQIGNGEIAMLGDKVMQTKNNYKLEVFNGDVGYLKRIVKDSDKEGSFIAVIYFPGDDREVEYTSESFRQLTLAYACTVHKSQGSEYDTVIIGVMSEHYVLLKRNLIYTAITRAKKKVIIVGSKKFYSTAISNVDTNKRNTHLANRITLLANDIKYPDRTKEVVPEPLFEFEKEALAV